MKKILPLIVCFVCLVFLSCKKKCRVCECEKNGQKTTEKNCAYGKAGIKNLDTWEKYLKEEKGYDIVKCKDE